MTERLARASSRRPWRVVALWLVAMVAAVPAIAMFLGDVLTTDIEVTRTTESKRADALLTRAFPEDRATQEREISEVVVVRGSTDEARIEALADELRQAGATAVETGPASGDARALLVGLGFDGEDDVEDVYAVVQRLDDEPGIEAAVTGEETSDADQGELSGDDLRNGELNFGLPAALVVLLLVFGTVVAGLVPLILAVVSIVVALALAALLGQAYDLSLYTVNMLTAMGLALGIDYSLFVLSRYREERGQGREPPEAIAAAGATASRAVLFSGLTFVLAMFGLVLVPSTIFRSLAAGAILVGIVSVAAALTLLPAVLGLLGDRVDALRLPFFGRVRHVGEPLLGRDRARGHAPAGPQPRRLHRPAAGARAARAGPADGLAGAERAARPLRVQAGVHAAQRGVPRPDDGAGGDRGDRRLARGRRAPRGGRSRRDRSSASRTVETSGDVTRLVVPIAGDPLGERAIDAVRDLRADLIPRASRPGAAALVTGDTAEELDYHETVDAWLVRVLAFVLGLSFVLLTIAFRSIVVPLKAIAANLLSVGAAYGLLVLVFQEGVGNELLGLTQAENVAAWVPLFLFAVLFGLSMDYQVFLLSRIRERYLRTGDNDEAVAYGVSSTARIITGAALIIIAVFWGFARGDLIMFQQMGFGVAVALLIDATIVRGVLVPAAMKLLGARNWYLPRWLAWLPDAHVEGHRDLAPVR